MNHDELSAEIRRLGPWHHDVEVVPGLWTGAVSASETYAQELGKPSVIQPFEALSRLLAPVYPVGLHGRSFLDCACNAGGYVFAAAELGATRGFGFDARAHWIKQAEFLARHKKGADLRFATCDLAAVPALQLAQFDVTLFSGILYHLPDPVAGLRIAADLTGELLIVNTAFQPADIDALALNVESDTEVMSGVDRLAWLPTSERVVAEMLSWCGFGHHRLLFREVYQGNGRGRIVILAAREKAIFSHYDSQPEAAGAGTGTARAAKPRWAERIVSRLR
jgi:SAM-dependent methyltransferase